MMADLERVYNVPLRREYLKAPNYERTKKAVKALKEFLLKHMKATEVKLGKNLNKEMWKNGIRNPPHHIKVLVIKDDKGIARAELPGHKYVEMTKEDREKAHKENAKEAKPAAAKPSKEEKEEKASIKKELKEGEQKIKQELKKLDKQTEEIKKTK